MALTERSCRAIVCTDKNKRYADAHGLSLLAHTNGRKYWVGRYKVHGKERTKSLGQYPSVSLAQAREAWTLFRFGPSDDKAVPTFAQVYEQLEPTRLRRGLKPARYYDVAFRKLPQWFTTMPVDTITPRVVADLMPMYFSSESKLEAKFVYMLISITLELAIDMGYIQVNPSRRVVKLLPTHKTKHHCSIAKDKAGKLVADVLSSASNTRFRIQLFFLLNMLTAVRAAELCTARWQDIDLDTMEWRIPGKFMKRGRPHIVPLSTQAAALFQYIHDNLSVGDNLFTFHNCRAPYRTTTTSGFLYRLGYKGVHTVHGNRALFATVMQEDFGYDYKVIDIQLSHSKKDSVAAAYDRASFMDKRRALMQQWADWLDDQAMSTEGSVGGILYPITRY